MYEVIQNVDLSSKVDASSKKFDQLLALNTLPTNSLNVQGLESVTQILDSCTQSIAKLETQIGQQANAISRRDEGEPIKDGKLNENETERIDIGTKIESKIEKELTSSSNSKTLESSPTNSYKPKGDELMFYICYNSHDLHWSIWIIVSI
ncbi:hypothetical protein M9H77_23515 [Catharanthus roseus]|uniref:Uncharacterized protein n=1 Tax=Catharanthus roseus TaxID=4058 RepID=A0ACC0AUR9_CATRO|nr:hypothetical protein M9H77_23515 [Catharanthus roseus]